MILASANVYSLLTGLGAATVYAVLALWGGRLQDRHTQALVWGGWLLHGLSVIVLLGSGDDGLIRFGFAPALSATVWLVLSFYWLEHQWFPLMQTRWALALLGGCRCCSP